MQVARVAMASALLLVLNPTLSQAAPDGKVVSAAKTAPAKLVPLAKVTPLAKALKQDTKVVHPKDVPEAIGASKSLWSAFKGGKWREAIAGCLVLLLFLWRRFASKLIIGKLNPWWVGFVTVLMGYLGSIPEALSSGAFAWSTFIWSGLLTSGEAMLLWQMAGKRLLPKIFGSSEKKEEDSQEEASEEEAPKEAAEISTDNDDTPADPAKKEE